MKKAKTSKAISATPPTKPLPPLILSASGFCDLLDAVRKTFLSVRVLLDPEATKEAVFARHVAMFILATHVGESIEAIQYRFSATRTEVEHAIRRVPKGFKKSWALKDSIRQISAEALKQPPS